MQFKGFQSAALIFVEGDFGNDGLDAHLWEGDVDFVDEFGNGLQVGIGAVGDDGICAGIGGEAHEVGELEGAVGFVGGLAGGPRRRGLGSIFIIRVVVIIVLAVLVAGDLGVLLAAFFLPGDNVFNDGDDILGLCLAELEDFAAGDGSGVHIDAFYDL